MSDTYILAIDLAKRSLQVCATAQGGAVQYADQLQVISQPIVKPRQRRLFQAVGHNLAVRPFGTMANSRPTDVSRSFLRFGFL
jgi:hypothetical protein